jgi:hypothetical protein
MKGRNGGSESITTTLEAEKAELRPLLRDFHPDRFRNVPVTPKEKKQIDDLYRILTAFMELHAEKKTMRGNTRWPERTPPPTEMPLTALVDGKLVRVILTSDRAANPQECFDEILKFHRDPVAYRQKIIIDNEAVQKQEVAREKAAEEARERRAQFVAERAALAQSISDRFGLTLDITRLAETDSVVSDRNNGQIQDIKKAIAVFESVGAAIAPLRGYTLVLARSGTTLITQSNSTITLCVSDSPNDITARIHEGVRMMDLQRRANEILTGATRHKFRFYASDFRDLRPELLIELEQRFTDAVERTEHGWVIGSKLVHVVHIERAKDDLHVGYTLSQTDNSRSTSVRFQIGVRVTDVALQGVIGTAGAEIERYYPRSILAHHKIPALSAYLTKQYGIRSFNFLNVFKQLSRA